MVDKHTCALKVVTTFTSLCIFVFCEEV